VIADRPVNHLITCRVIAQAVLVIAWRTCLAIRAAREQGLRGPRTLRGRATRYT